MNNLPLEIFEQIINDLVEHTSPNTDRFPTLTKASKKAILSARVLWSRYRHQDPLLRLFLDAVAEVPFLIADPTIEESDIMRLGKFSRSPYALHVTTMSYCPMPGPMPPYDAAWFSDPEALDFAQILQRFPALEHIRYYTPPRKFPREALAHNRLPRLVRTNSNLGNHEITTCNEESGHPNLHLLRHLQRCFQNGRLVSFTMPYLGNVDSSYAMPLTSMYISCPSFAANLRRISVNLWIGGRAAPVFDSWVYFCPNLEYLEIALSRHPEANRISHRLLQFWRPDDERDDRIHNAPEKLTEVRLLFDSGFLMATDSLVMGLARFRNLKKLGLAHCKLWDLMGAGLFSCLRDRSMWTLDLDVLWLLNPLHSPHNPAVPRLAIIPESFQGLIDEGEASGAAREVRIIHRPFAWGESLKLCAGIGHPHEGFEVFEE